ncbi:SDR family oxidoreductase [Cyanobium sp. Alchichica 3B3-8F6]|uniref:SDR family oxidoreductase n=1 Tax=Cyanobium sp. Alchichica 3B3-8F6 TaxID=2823696 RepID=UPI0020CCD253|nr:SDR family oxidoreductase [Cyanobium sp. Alchichica 3B3-8F6]MCP9882386.1 SDR family oxidoreductase [Cyanobium sp. Alchichica 3B3-8F6]
MSQGTALIVGASSSLGHAIARSLSLEHSKVYATYLSREPKSLTALSNLELCRLDIRDWASIDSLFQFISQSGSLLRTVVYAVAKEPFDEVNRLGDKSYIDEAFDVNFKGAVKVIQAYHSYVSRIHRTSGEKAITIIGSESGEYGGIQIPIYAASKGALNSFVKGYSRELADLGIRLNIVSPGVISSGKNQYLDDQHLQRLPFKRAARCDEVADVVSWLSSTKASYVSGAILKVTGAR